MVKLRERRKDIDTVSELKIRDKLVQEQEKFNKIGITKCNRIYKFIGKMGLSDYLEDKGRGESQRLIARIRGNLEKRNKHWMSENGKLCLL